MKKSQKEKGLGLDRLFGIVLVIFSVFSLMEIFTPSFFASAIYTQSRSRISNYRISPKEYTPTDFDRIGWGLLASLCMVLGVSLLRSSRSKPEEVSENTENEEIK